MDRERLDKWCEWGIIGLVLAILVYGPLAIGAVRPLDFLVIQALTVLALALWLFRIWLVPSHRLFWPPICWAVVAFVVFAGVRYWQSDIEYIARQELLRILVYAALFFIIINNLHHMEPTNIIVFTLVFLGVAIAIYAIYQFATNSVTIWHYPKPEQYAKRASGTYICPNHLAGFLELVLPLGLAYTISGRFKPVTKILLGYASLVILAGIGVSISRGGWIATFLSLLVFFWVLLRHPSSRLPALLMLIVMLAGATVFVWNARQTHKRFQELFVAGGMERVRFLLWRPAYVMWQDHFWWGVGPGHFDYRFPAYRPADVQLRPELVHNDYLNALADWGVVGTAVVAVPWLLLFWGLGRTWKYVQRNGSNLSSPKSNRWAFLLGGGVALLAILLHSFVDFNMHIPANAIVVVTLIALLTSQLRFATDDYWVRLRWWLRGLVTLAGLAVLAYLGWQDARRWSEYGWLQQVKATRDYTNERVELLRKAQAAEPMNPDTVYNLGENLRGLSWLGNAGYEDLARQAMNWFELGMRLNPYDTYNPMRYGMCLHWMGRHAEAEPFFEKALKLDPNNYYVVAHEGWHRVQLGDYAGARLWFEKSLKLKPVNNLIAQSYLGIVTRKISEQK